MAIDCGVATAPQVAPQFGISALQCRLNNRMAADFSLSAADTATHPGNHHRLG